MHALLDLSSLACVLVDRILFPILYYSISSHAGDIFSQIQYINIQYCGTNTLFNSCACLDPVLSTDLVFAAVVRPPFY